MIHQYKNNGYNIVLDVNSGSVHVVDDVVYDMIPIIEEGLNNNCDETVIKEKVLSAFKKNLGGRRDRRCICPDIGIEKCRDAVCT